MLTTPILRLFQFLCIVLAAGLCLAGCSTPKQPPMPVGALKLGVANFTQPMTPSDMLAGYSPDDVPAVDKKVLNEMDALLASVLAGKSKNNFQSRESALHCSGIVRERSGRSNNQAALRLWSAIGRCMGVDLLVVPQIYEWRERDGGAIGVVTPAKVVMDVFVLDVRNEALISRSRYDETQSALTNNLLEADKFFKRGGKWVQARDLAEEGMDKADKERGL
jgi:hypothetical protein